MEPGGCYGQLSAGYDQIDQRTTPMEWRYNNPTFEVDRLHPAVQESPWGGHRKFAYDLVSALSPQSIVELGAFVGASLFAFAQAIKDANLSTSLTAVDTWLGDEHAGYYGDGVFQFVQEVSSSLFPEQKIRLLRKTFLEARADVPDNSVSILHIDGLHTYEAVKEDFETWLCKMATDGIVLFHDVATDKEYGSVIYWREISQRYPSLTFHHSHGLGVLFPKGDRHRPLVMGTDWIARNMLYALDFVAQSNALLVQKFNTKIEEQGAQIALLERQLKEQEDLLAQTTRASR